MGLRIRVKIDEKLFECSDPADLLYRLSWAGAGAKLSVSGSKLEKYWEAGEAKFPDYLDPAIEGMLQNITFEKSGGPYDAKVRLVNSKSGRWNSAPGIFIGNPSDSGEGKELTGLAHYAGRSESRQRIAENRVKLLGFLEEWSGLKSAYVIATGPSFSDYTKFSDYDSSFVVTCNSAIINRDFMEAARPNLVVFADPIFHFGPSKYAGEFRRQLLDAAANFEFKIAVLDKYYYLFRHFLPELEDRTVFVPAGPVTDEWNCDLRYRFEVRSTQNILTLLMLPFASTVARRIRIMGCDGRDLGADSYFWGHSPSAQISDKMQNIQEVHPGFFAIDYNDYYLRHCQSLEDQLRAIEKRGRTVESVSQSKIPALAKRASNGELRRQVDERINDALLSDHQRKLRFSCRRLRLEKGAIEFVSINPSLRSRMGHSLYQDKSIRSVIGERGGDFVSLGSAELESELRDSFILPVFRTTVWEIHRSRAEKRQKHVERFLDDLFDGLVELAKVRSLEKATLFLYLGHPSIVPGFLRRWIDKPFECGTFVINLFSGFFDQPGCSEEAEELRLIGGLKGLVGRVEGVRLVCDSEPFANRLADIAEVQLPVLPMCPSQELNPVGTGNREGSDRIRVVYPSHAENIRGYKILVRFLYRHSKTFEDRFEFVIRSYAPWTRSLPSRFRRRNITWITGLLSEEDYVELLSSSDVILLPYSPQAFGYRTSSILTEAIHLGIPVVTTAVSWLGLQVRKLDAGWLIGTWDVEGMRECFERLWREREKLESHQFSGKAFEWLEENSVKKFVSGIEASIAEDGGEKLGDFAGTAAQRLVLDSVCDLPEKKKFGLFRVSDLRKWVVETAPEFVQQPARLVFGFLMMIKNNLAQEAKRGIQSVPTTRGKTAAISLERLAVGFPPEEGKILNEIEVVEECLRLEDVSEVVRYKIFGETLTPFNETIEGRDWKRCNGEESESIDCLVLGSNYQSDEVEEMLGSHDTPGCVWMEFDNEREDRFEELGRFFDRAGYQVWISEWHDSVESEMLDSWFRLVVFPSYPVRSGGKGSILAFRRYISNEEMSVAVTEALGSRGSAC